MTPITNLCAYIPQDRLRALARGHELPTRARGSAMFADISGFTPLTEQLVRQLGPQRGAEELTALLNRVYGALIAQVEHFGGSVIGFSGDAITCWFDDLGVGSWELGVGDSTPTPNSHPPSPAHAVACALAMRDAMAQFAEIDTPAGTTAALNVKIAIASGPARRFLVGDPHVQQFDILAGTTLDRLGAIVELAEHDDVLVDAQTLDQVGEAALVVGWRERAQTGARAAAIGGLAEPALHSQRPAIVPDDLPDALVRPWLSPSVYTWLRASPDPFLAELRPAVALMLQFSGIDYDQDDAGARLDAHIRGVQEIVTRYEGVLVDLTMADKGGYLYAAFGAPVAHEDDARRAVQAALALQPLSDAPFGEGVRIGLSQGIMRTGPYGSITRRAYGVLGDDVNLACRLMNHAMRGQVLASGQLQRSLASVYNWLALPAIRVKGKREPVAVFRLLSDAAPTSGAPDRAGATPAMIGRAAERATLAGAVEKLLAGAGGLLIVEGEAGIGKSRLLAELDKLLGEHGVTGFTAAGLSVEQQTPYRAWRDLFAAYFGLDDASTSAARQARVQEQVAGAAPDLLDRLSLLNDVLGLSVPETDLTRALGARLRSESLMSLLVELLRARASQRPLVLVLEDAHWLDSRSWELAVRVARTLVASTQPLPILLVIATRPLETAHPALEHITALLRMPGARRLVLGALTPDDTLALAAARIGVAAADMPVPVVDLVRARAGGNPLFAEELIVTLHEAGLIQVVSSGSDRQARPRCVVTGDLRQAGQILPATLQGLLLARIDRLPAQQQLTLKVASVVGVTFPYPPLHHALTQHAALGDTQLKVQLRSLAAQDFTWLEEPEPNLAYSFKHVLTQEAAYQTLLFAQRRALHGAVAGWYEQTFGSSQLSELRFEFEDQKAQNANLRTQNSELGPYFPLLAHHYRQAEDDRRERYYARLAGIQAADQYANAEAVGFFTRALELTPGGELTARYELLFEREAAHELLGAREAQARDLAALAELAEALDDNRRRAEIARSRARYAERVGNIAEMRLLATQAVA
ncbi:MAG TPA: AAA family ATPase, partial [Roseiflexaceae bacterium]|nr:AAA family ATPase [Roseiflexaceae bacterium]